MLHPSNQHDELLHRLKQHPRFHQILYNKAFVNKEIQVTEWTCCRHFDDQLDKETLIRQISRQKARSGRIPGQLPKDLQIVLDFHAFRRWNERISPCTDIHLLRSRMIQLLHLGRVQLSPKGWGLIDQDILFGYKISDRSLIIQTFIGRISLIPALANYKAVLRFNASQNDRLNLYIPANLLKHQHLPLLPREVVKFAGTRNQYQLEEYRYRRKDSSLGSIFALTVNQGTQVSLILIDPLQPPKQKLYRSVLYLLLLKGYQDFVLEHILIYKAAKLQKLLAKQDAPSSLLKRII
ncbi:hypothetical protein [Thermoactinomyces sp. CICC 10523]|uniref:hypothetical protein n=1 Tax=Thermoactinomyces sp. CICC 10523 TaxID=2767428 RepID=UPI0018DEC793|nr:hypothetical protein [Thermoactinomyces sp. CICC 10523]MBH8597748.1 hypothetical protein [Thermoactinomyces sp. CICC 10523]